VVSSCLNLQCNARVIEFFMILSFKIQYIQNYKEIGEMVMLKAFGAYLRKSFFVYFLKHTHSLYT
jgi:hypothetical protein